VDDRVGLDTFQLALTWVLPAGSFVTDVLRLSGIVSATTKVPPPSDHTFSEAERVRWPLALSSAAVLSAIALPRAVDVISTNDGRVEAATEPLEANATDAAATTIRTRRAVRSRIVIPRISLSRG
jgi:hypothetical protein